MYHLLRIKLVGVGHDEARFDPLTLDFRDEHGNARQESALWLSNTGGKTSLLGLVYSLLLPHRRDFLGNKSVKQPRALENYIRSADVSHVVLEWGKPTEGASLPGVTANTGGTRFVTGQVLAWNGDSLDRRYYSFEPQPGILELETLPFLRGNGRTPIDEYIRQLEKLASSVGNRIHLTVTAKLSDWQRHLANRGLDPEVFKYQLIMNEDEGGAGKFLDFKDGDSFVNFLLRLVGDTEAAGKLGPMIVEVANLYAQRPHVQAELALCSGIDKLIPDLVAGMDALAAARTHRDTLRKDGLRLLARIEASEAMALTEQQTLAAQADQLSSDMGKLDKEIERWHFASLLLELQVAQYRSRHAEAALADAIELAKIAAMDVSAWAIAEERLRERELKAEGKALAEELKRLEAGSADLFTSYERAAAVYRQQLKTRQSARRTEVKLASRHWTEAADRGEKARMLQLGTTRREGELKSQQKEIRGQQSRIEAEQKELVQHGALRSGESVPAAQDRLASDLDELASRLSMIGDTLQALSTEQSALLNQRGAKANLLTKLETELRNLRERRESLVSRGETLADAPEIRDYGNGEPVDVAGQAPAILAYLARRAADARRELVALGVDAKEAERAYEFLQNKETLPPRRDVEQAVDILAKHGVWAQSGWDYLPGNVAKEKRPSIIALRPEVVAGVVVNVGDVPKAVSILKPAMVPDGPLVVAESSALRDARPLRAEEACWHVLPPSPAYYDPDAAADEMARCTLRLKETMTQREVLVEFETNVAKLQSGLDALWAECRAKSFAQYDLEINQHERQADDLGHEIDEIDKRLPQIELERRELERKRQEAEQQRARLVRHSTQVDGFAIRALHGAELQQRLDDTARHLKEVAETLVTCAADIEWAKEEAAASDRKVRELELALQELDRELRDVGDVGIGLDTGEEENRSLEELRTAFQTAREIYLRNTSGSETGLRLDMVRKELASLDARLGTTAPEVLNRTDELLAGSNGESLATRLAAAQKAAEADTDTRREEIECDLRAQEAAQVLVDARDKASGAGELSPGLIPSSFAEAQEFLTRSQRKFEESRDQKRVKTDQIRARDAEALDAGNRNRMFGMLAMSLKGSLSVDAQEEGQGEVDLIDLADAQEKVVQLQPAQKEAEKGVADRREDLRRRADHLRNFVRKPDFTAIEGPVKERFLEPDDELLGEIAAEKQGWLRELIAQVEADLKNIERHRELVAIELRRLVKETLALITAVQSGSELPDVASLHEWAGQQYLRIYYLQTNPETLLPRLEAFVDNLIRAKVTRIDGEQLLIDAVRSVVDYRDRERHQQFEVTVLKPIVGLPRARASVSDISKWSGGQKLTTALLIYCVLVRLRVRSRGAGPEARRTVLFLDNPTGTANLVDLVDLQLMVAREFGVQVIIATGVNDYSAIAAYPHVIRLRNRRNRKGTDSFVQFQASGTPEEVDDGMSGGMVSAVRVARRADELPRAQVN